jgi:hypothetical protein
MLLPSVQIGVPHQDHDAYEERMGKVLGYPVLRYPRVMGDHKTVRYMDETGRQILAKLCGKGDASEAEVTGLEYWDEAGNMTIWKTCRAPRFLIVVSHLVHGGHFPLSCSQTSVKSRRLLRVLSVREVLTSKCLGLTILAAAPRQWREWSAN